jgi:thiamine kinase-like enzyme
VTAASQQILGEGEGFLGDLIRLTLEYDRPEGLPATMIAKMPKLANRAVGELLGAYERETMFYLELAPRVPLNMPKMYFGDFDRDKASEKQEQILRTADGLPTWTLSVTSILGRFIAGRKKRRYILLLEDIHDADPGDQLKGVSAEQADRVLQEMAKVHRKFWDSPADHFWLLPFNIDANMRYNMFDRSLPAFVNEFRDEVKGGLDLHLELIQAERTNLVNEIAAAPQTLLHNDLRLDNVFFRPDEVVLFDFQLVRHGPAAYDVAYFLSGALEDDVSQDDIESLLARYHETLVGDEILGYRLPEFVRHYHVSLLVVLSSLATIDQMDMGDGRGMQLMRSWIRRLRARLDAI